MRGSTNFQGAAALPPLIHGAAAVAYRVQFSAPMKPRGVSGGGSARPLSPVSLSLSLVLLAAAGCAADHAGEPGYDYDPRPEPPTQVQRLDAIPGMQVRAIVRGYVTADFTGVELELQIDHAGRESGVRTGSDVYCPALHDSFTLALGDERFPMSQRGSWRLTGLDDQRACSIPSGKIPITLARQKAGSTLVLSDESRTITVPLGDLLLPRQVELLSHASWDALRLGDDVSVRWSPAQDVDLQGGASLIYRHATSGPVFTAGLEASGVDTLGFTLPGEATALGSGTVEVQLQRAAQSCGPICALEARFSVTTAASVLGPARP